MFLNSKLSRCIFCFRSVVVYVGKRFGCFCLSCSSSVLFCCWTWQNIDTRVAEKLWWLATVLSGGWEGTWVVRRLGCRATELNFGDFLGQLHIQYGIGGASGVAGGQLPPCALCPAPRLPPPVVVIKNYMCPLHPSHPFSQRKFYVKIHEMCQNTAQSILDFFLFPVVNGQSTCC